MTANVLAELTMHALKSKTVLRAFLIALLPAMFVFWLTTAPASMGIQRCVSGGNGGPVARVVCNLTDLYESPMSYVGRVAALRRVSDSMADKWCEWLGAPETIP